PAKIAGCKDIILCTPTNKQGEVAPAVLYAAKLCGVTQIFKIGGAAAIGAMAYGTQSIPQVHKIFGPGNRYVTKAKEIVSNSVAIDMPAGPSEVMVIADNSAKAEFVASDLLSQAEHGADSQVVLVCNNKEFAEKVKYAVAKQLETLERKELAQKALQQSSIVILEKTEEQIEFANTYAPEHLIISTQNPWEIADKITAAGSIFIGNYTPESAGDYASGTNHTLPTAGWAKSFSGVNIDSFTRKITYQQITTEGLGKLGPIIIEMAQAEGLQAHANAVKIRINN
ncbi:MAG: histidinol dehydrogenase, partial [Bacteroidia bacterium]|nr:histidinol dehydrogenase [Bacteroidia bacterium]